MRVIVAAMTSEEQYAGLSQCLYTMPTLPQYSVIRVLAGPHALDARRVACLRPRACTNG